MNTTRLQENISALTDGELPACDVELTMAALADPQGQAAWHAYRLIGDVLRTGAAEVDASPGFAAGLAARLAAEPLPGPPGEPVAQGTAAPDGGAHAADPHQDTDHASAAGAHVRPDGAGDAAANAGKAAVPAVPSAPPAAEGPAPALVP